MVSYIALIITALLGISGLLFKTDRDDKKSAAKKDDQANGADKGASSEKKNYSKQLTIPGIIVLILLITAFVISIVSQEGKDRESEKAKADALNKSSLDSAKNVTDSLRFLTTILSFRAQHKSDSTILRLDSDHFNITVEKFGEQLALQSLSLENIKRTLLPIKDIFVSFRSRIALDKFPELAEYKKRLDAGIKALLPALTEKLKKKIETGSFQNDTIDGIAVVINRDSEIGEVEITKNSSLWPSGQTEKLAHCVFDQVATLYFYKDSISLNELPYLDYTLLPRKIIGDQIRHDWKNPDLRISFAEDPTSNGRITIQYNVHTKTLVVYGRRLKSDPQNWQGTGKVVSVLDLCNSQVFLNLQHFPFSMKREDSDKVVNPEITSLSLNLTNGLTLPIIDSRHPGLNGEIGDRKYYWHFFPKSLDDILTVKLY